MTDYFAYIIPDGVTGVAMCDDIVESGNSKACSHYSNVTPEVAAKGDGCNTMPKSYKNPSHLVTQQADNSVTLKSRETQVLHPLRLVTPDYYTAFFEERAGIAEFDGFQSREEAEIIAYNDTLFEWACHNPRAGYKITHCAYCGEAIDFSARGYMSWGKVCCCYTSQDNEHLRPYLQSRIKEAKSYLKTIKINQPIYEANNE